MDVDEDTWEDGEIGRPQNVLHERSVGAYKRMEDVLKQAAAITDIPMDRDNWAIFGGEEGRIDGQGLVDERNFYVGDDKRFMEQFKRGEVKAWNAYVTISFRFAKVWSPDEKEIKKLINLQVI
jgi:hypothetical protein